MWVRKASASCMSPSRSDVGDFGFDHPELGEVAAGLGFFGAEGGAEGVDLAEGEGGGFDVELAGLGEVGLVVVEVVHLEELGGAFAGVGGEDGRVGADEAVGVEVLGAARMMVARTRRMADWRGVRTQRWRCSMRKSTPCSLREMGKGVSAGTTVERLRGRGRRARSRRGRGGRRGRGR